MIRPRMRLASLLDRDGGRTRHRSQLGSAVEECTRDFRPQAGPRRREALDPERTLVQTVENVLPGEPDAAVDLDRRLAHGYRGLSGERLRGRGCELCLPVTRRDAPGC